MPADAPAPPLSSPSPPVAVWQLRLLGAVQARCGQRVVTRWPSRPAAALLARLALAPQRAHPREELVELLWPGVALDVGRNRLRQALSTLRTLLEHDGLIVIDADRQSLRLHDGALHCDAVDFERLARRGATADALALYGGELMPGHYDDWVLDLRRQLAAVHERLAAQPIAEAEAPLPALWTTAFGLAPHLQAMPPLLASQRLVSLVGPGGSGKTRLALELAHRLRAQATPGAAFDRVAFIALADADSDAQAMAMLARGLDLAATDTLAELASWLGQRRLLLVLDNLEQLPHGGAALVLQLLGRVPTAHLLLTTRRPCGVAGEHVHAVTGLPAPAEADPDALHNPAVALFIDRARGLRHGWVPDDHELRDVAALVRQLDGLPLALELAASRLGQLTPQTMLQLLNDPGHDAPHLQLLSRPGPRAGHDLRPASIEHVIDWSWQRLSPDEQQALAAVALSPGGCRPAALPQQLQRSAAAVSRDVDALLSHALLRLHGQGRLQAPEPVREFVRQRLPADQQRQARIAWRQWLLAWAQALGPSPLPAAVDAEIDHVMAQWHDPPEPLAPALWLALALRAHWDHRGGVPAHALDDLAHLLQRHEGDGGDRALCADVHELLAYLRFEAGFVDQARQHADRALQLAGDDPARRAHALVRRAWVTLASGRSEDDGNNAPQAAPLQQMLEQALALARQAGDRAAQARALHQLAVLHSHLRRDVPRAEAQLAQSQALWQNLGDRRKALARLRNRGQCWLQMGREDDALACFQACTQQAADDGDVLGQIDGLLSLSTLLVKRRQWQQALDCDRRCLRLCWQHRHRHGLAYALWNPARPLARLHRPEAAQRVMAFAATFWERSFGPLAAADRRTVRLVRRLVQAQLGAARAEALWIDGATLPITDAVALVLRD